MAVMLLSGHLTSTALGHCALEWGGRYSLALTMQDTLVLDLTSQLERHNPLTGATVHPRGFVSTRSQF